MLPDVFEQQMAANRLAYEQNRDRIRLAGSGHYAAIAEGRLIVLTEDFDAAVKAVRFQYSRHENPIYGYHQPT